ncbi:Mitochondrial import inner membrane translocase subunit Tim13-B [Taenia solium]|eukprot:TsM_001158600 transcript=TsM_001158600 gene=TsM_001158600
MDQQPSALSSLTPAQRAQLVDQMKAEVAIASTRELMDQLTQKCFEKCVSKPGASLDNSEQKCLGNCMDRYMDSVNLISKVFVNRLRQEANKLQQLS